MNARVFLNLHPAQMKEVLAAKVGRLLEFHRCDSHDCKTHGNWAHGQGDEPGSQFSAQELTALAAKRQKAAPPGTQVKTGGTKEFEPWGTKRALKGRAINGVVNTTDELTEKHLREIDKEYHGQLIFDNEKEEFVVPPPIREPRNANARQAADYQENKYPSQTGHGAYRLLQAGAYDLYGGGELTRIIREERPIMVEYPSGGKFGSQATHPVRFYEMKGTKGLVLAVTIDSRSETVTSAYITYADRGFPNGPEGRTAIRREVEKYRKENGIEQDRYEVLTIEEATQQFGG